MPPHLPPCPAVPRRYCAFRATPPAVRARHDGPHPWRLRTQQPGCTVSGAVQLTTWACAAGLATCMVLCPCARCAAVRFMPHLRMYPAVHRRARAPLPSSTHTYTHTPSHHAHSHADPACSDAEVLSMFAMIINRLRSKMEAEVRVAPTARSRCCSMHQLRLVGMRCAARACCALGPACCPVHLSLLPQGCQPDAVPLLLPPTSGRLASALQPRMRLLLLSASCRCPRFSPPFLSARCK